MSLGNILVFSLQKWSQNYLPVGIFPRELSLTPSLWSFFSWGRGQGGIVHSCTCSISYAFRCVKKGQNMLVRTAWRDGPRMFMVWQRLIWLHPRGRTKEPWRSTEIVWRNSFTLILWGGTRTKSTQPWERPITWEGRWSGISSLSGKSWACSLSLGRRMRYG